MLIRLKQQREEEPDDGLLWPLIADGEVVL
jgi:hypothetical protein